MTIQPIDDNSDAAIVQAARELLLEYGRFVLAAKGPAQFCFGALENESTVFPGAIRRKAASCCWRLSTAKLPDVWAIAR
jgi:hypothetical protein